MNTIISYVDTMFLNLPETKEILQVKEDILANMADKFHELVANGETENAAIGQVISEFGNIDEVLEEMNIKRVVQEQTDEQGIDDQIPVLTEENVIEIINGKRSMAIKIGLGTLLSCVSLSLLAFFLATGSEGLAMMAFVVMIAVAVGFFITGGMENSKYSFLEKPFVLTGQLRRDVEERKQLFRKSYSVSMAMGTVLCILSLTPIFFGVMIGEDNNDQFMMRGIALMFVIIGFGVFLFIYAGNIEGTFNLLLDKGLNYQPTKKEIKKNAFIDKIDAILWSVTVAVFFIWGSFFDGYGVSWIVFPIAGVISSIWDKD